MSRAIVHRSPMPVMCHFTFKLKNLVSAIQVGNNGLILIVMSCRKHRSLNTLLRMI